MDIRFTQMVASFTLVGLLVWQVGLVKCNPDGAPIESCADMSATKHGASSSTNPCQYEIIPEKLEILSSETLPVKITHFQNMTSVYFKGFMMMAFKEGDISAPIGSFQTSDPEVKTMDCPGLNPRNAITQTSNSIKYSVDAVWIPPTDFVGNVVFQATYVRSTYNFWERQPSPVVQVRVGSPSDTTAASTAGGSSESSTGSSSTATNTQVTSDTTGSSTQTPLTSTTAGTTATPTTKRTTVSTSSTSTTTAKTTPTSPSPGGASRPLQKDTAISIILLLVAILLCF